jgi:hypothetical protein
METYPIDHPKRHGRTICRCKSLSIRGRGRAHGYSREMKSFSDNDASVEAKMMAATANSPTT